MTLRCYSVIILTAGAVPHDALAQELKNVHDWIRLGNNNYFVLTHRSLQDIKNAFRANIMPTDTIFVMRTAIDDTQGWVPPAFDDWVVKARAKLVADKPSPAIGTSPGRPALSSPPKTPKA